MRVNAWMSSTASFSAPELERLFEAVSRYLALLAELAGLRILSALCDGERSVGDVVRRVASTPTNVSRHLNLLYRRGVLTRRREGVMTFYSVADANAVALCRGAWIHIAGLAEHRTVMSRALHRFIPQH